MAYRCVFGCRSYNALCDGCDSAVSSDNPYESEETSDNRFKAAKEGMTLNEYLEREEAE